MQNEVIQVTQNPDPAIDAMEDKAREKQALSRAAQEASRANTLAVSNTKLAACMAALGFPSDCDPAEDVSTSKKVREFMFKARSVRPEFAHLSVQIARWHQSGVLEKREPMHPLCVMMRAMHNYDRMIDIHKGVVMNLRSTPDERMTVYRRCSQPDPRSNFSAQRVEVTDMALAAALAGVGIPVLAFDGPEGARRYWVPQNGYAVRDEKGQVHLEDAAALIRRAPTSQDPRRLALEVTSPMHPVVLAYDALNARAVLKKLLNRRAPLLHVKASGLQALITANHTGRVIDQLTERFGCPPI